MYLSVFKIGGWKILQTEMSEEFIDEDEPRLSIRIHSKQRFILRYSTWNDFLCDNPNVKESEPLCEDDAMLRATALCSQNRSA